MIKLLFMKHKPLISHPCFKHIFQEGQNAGPPPLIPGLGQQGSTKVASPLLTLDKDLALTKVNICSAE